MAYTKDEWWETTRGGMRIGWMEPAVFLQAVAKMFGGCAQKSPRPIMHFAAWAGVGKSTAYRWAEGSDPIPKWVALLLTVEMTVWEQGDDHTIVEAPWLPYSKGANGRQYKSVVTPDGGTDQPTTPDRSGVGSLPLVEGAEWQRVGPPDGGRN